MFGKGKPEQNKIDNEFDFDAELDGDQFDFNDDPMKDDRKPVEKAKDGFLSGVKTGLQDTNYLRSTMKEVLPKEYGTSLDTADHVSGKIGEIYASAAKEIKPAIKDLKKTLIKTIPPDAKYVPKFFKEKMEQWAEEGVDPKITTEEDQRTSFISNNLAEIYAVQQDRDDKVRAEDDQKELISEAIDISKHKEIFGAVANIDRGISRIDQYLVGPNLSFQKKSLEVMYRQLFALQDLVKLGNKDVEIQSNNLPAITKNTALPEFVKQSNTEFLAEYNKKRLVESIGKNLFGGGVEYMDKVFAKMGDTMKSKISEGVQGFREGLSMFSDMKNMTSDMGVDPTEMAGDVAGKSAVQMAGRKFAKSAVGKIFGKSERLTSFGKNAEIFAKDLPRFLNDKREGALASDDYSAKGMFMKAIASFMPQMNEKEKMQVDGIDATSAPHKRTEKTINEIIPGYLARMLAQQEQLNKFMTKKWGEDEPEDKQELKLYDHLKGDFGTESSVKQSLQDRLVSQSSVKTLQSKVDTTLTHLGADKLDTKVQESLRDAILELSSKMKTGKLENFSGSKAFKGDGAEEAQKFLTAYLEKAKDNPDEMGVWAKNFREISEGIHNPRKDLQHLIDLGYGKQLKEQGLLEEDNTHDATKFFGKYKEQLKAPTKAEGEVVMGVPPRPEVVKLDAAPTPPKEVPKQWWKKPGHYFEQYTDQAGTVLGKKLDTGIDQIAASSAYGKVKSVLTGQGGDNIPAWLKEMENSDWLSSKLAATDPELKKKHDVILAEKKKAEQAAARQAAQETPNPAGVEAVVAPQTNISPRLEEIHVPEQQEETTTQPQEPLVEKKKTRAQKKKDKKRVLQQQAAPPPTVGEPAPVVEEVVQQEAPQMGPPKPTATQRLRQITSTVADVAIKARDAAEAKARAVVEEMKVPEAGASADQPMESADAPTPDARSIMKGAQAIFARRTKSAADKLQEVVNTNPKLQELTTTLQGKIQSGKYTLPDMRTMGLPWLKTSKAQESSQPAQQEAPPTPETTEQIVQKLDESTTTVPAVPAAESEFLSQAKSMLVTMREQAIKQAEEFTKLAQEKFKQVQAPQETPQAEILPSVVSQQSQPVEKQQAAVPLPPAQKQAERKRAGKAQAKTVVTTGHDWLDVVVGKIGEVVQAIKDASPVTAISDLKSSIGGFAEKAQQLYQDTSVEKLQQIGQEKLQAAHTAVKSIASSAQDTQAFKTASGGFYSAKAALTSAPVFKRASGAIKSLQDDVKDRFSQAQQELPEEGRSPLKTIAGMSSAAMDQVSERVKSSESFQTAQKGLDEKAQAARAKIDEKASRVLGRDTTELSMTQLISALGKLGKDKTITQPQAVEIYKDLTAKAKSTTSDLAKKVIEVVSKSQGVVPAETPPAEPVEQAAVAEQAPVVRQEPVEILPVAPVQPVQKKTAKEKKKSPIQQGGQSVRAKKKRAYQSASPSVLSEQAGRAEPLITLGMLEELDALETNQAAMVATPSPAVALVSAPVPLAAPTQQPAAVQPPQQVAPVEIAPVTQTVADATVLAAEQAPVPVEEKKTLMGRLSGAISSAKQKAQESIPEMAAKLGLTPQRAEEITADVEEVSEETDIKPNAAMAFIMNVAESAKNIAVSAAEDLNGFVKASDSAKQEASPTPGTQAAADQFFKPSSELSGSDEQLDKIRQAILTSNTHLENISIQLHDGINVDKSFSIFGKRKAKKDKINHGEGVSGALGNAVTKTAKGVGGLASRAARGAVDLNVWSVKTAGRAISWGGGKVKDALFGPTKPQDVYFEGEKTPRLFAAGMTAGKYLKKFSLKPVKNHKDIDEPILDEKGNEIITGDEISKLYTKGMGARAVRLITTPAKAVGGLLKKIGGAYANALPGMMGAQARIAKSIVMAPVTAVKKVWGALDGAKDVYVVGTPEPVLYAKVMKAGGYISKLSGKPIKKASDIDGPVIDIEGNTLITMDDIRKGVVDKGGKPIKSAMEKITGVLGSAAKTVWGAQKAAWGLTKKIGGAMLKGVKGLAGGLLNGFSTEVNGAKSVKVLEEIRDILKAGQNPKKAAFGDMDGDGDKDGSWQDLKQKSKERIAELKEKAKNKFNKAKDTASKAGTTMFDMLKGLGGIMGKVGDLVGGVKDLFSLGKGATGLLGKAGALLGGVKGLGARALLALPTLGGITGAASAATTAIGGAAAGAGTALSAGTAAAPGVIAAAGSTLAAAGTGLMTFLASPVVLGVAATAAVAYGGYKLYKHLKKMSDLDKLRLVQYGFQADDQKNFERVRKLEEFCKPFATVGLNGGKTTIDEKNMDMKEMLDTFDIEKDDQAGMERFFRWYQERFKPVYLTNGAVVAIIAKKSKIEMGEVSSFDKQDAATYLNEAKFENGPYSIFTLPIDEESYKVTGAADVKAIIAEIKKLMGLDKVAPGKLTAGGKVVTAGAIAAITTEKEMVAEMNGQAAPEPQAAAVSLQAEIKKTAAGVAVTTTLTPIGITDDSGNEEYGDESTLQALIDLSNLKQEGKYSALEAVKYKTYGLVDLEQSKIKSLNSVEKAVLKDLVYKKGQASWEGSPTKLLETMRGEFGIASMEGPDADAWKEWLVKRFLPSFLKYVGLTCAYSGKDHYDDNVGMLKVSQQFDVAKQMVGLDVWKHSYSPWPGYKVSTDGNVAKANLAFLEDTVKKEKAIEEKKTQESDASKGAGLSDKEKQAAGLAAKSPTQQKSSSTQPKQEITPGPDAEPKPTAVASQAGGITSGGTTPGTLKLADGPVLEGRPGASLLSFAKGVKLDGVNPMLLKQFFGMAEEYQQITGKKMMVTDGYRSYEDQVRMKEKYGARAATPGKSLHGFGLAMDVNSPDLDKADSLGLMRKYGFVRPLGGEPWHLEPIGTQIGREEFQRNPGLAIDAIKSGMGRGGGGMGSIKGTPLNVRDDAMIKTIMSANVAPNVKISGTKSGEQVTLPTPILPGQEPPKASVAMGAGSSPITPAAGPKDAPTAKSTAPVGKGAGAPPTVVSPDAEPKPTAVAQAGAAPAKQAGAVAPPTAGAKVIEKANNDSTNMPTGLGAKIPDPDGTLASVKNTVEAAAKVVGVKPDLAVSTVAIESGFNPNAAAKSSSAKGLNQFINRTWNAMVRTHGEKYGIVPGTSPFDPKANALMGAEYIKENEKILKKATGDSEVDPTDIYSAHFLGPYGAAKFNAALKMNPQTYAHNLLPSAAGSNKSIFYENNGAGRPRTVGEIRAVLEQKVKTKAESFGIKLKMDPQAKIPSAPAQDTSAATNRQAAGAPQLQQASELNARASGAAAPSIAPKRMNAYGEPMQDAPAAQEKPPGMMNANWVPPATESQQAPAPKPANASIEGFNYADMTRDAEKTSQLNAGLTNPLKTTEDLLAKSVITQGSMLKTLTAIYDHMVKTASDRANQDKKESQPATEPQRVDSIQARQAAAIAAGSAEDRNLPSSSFGLTKSPIEMRRRI